MFEEVFDYLLISNEVGALVWSMGFAILPCGWLQPHAPITPNFQFSCSREIVGDYVKKKIMAHRFYHYYSRRCRHMVSELPGVIGPSVMKHVFTIKRGCNHSWPFRIVEA